MDSLSKKVRKKWREEVCDWIRHSDGLVKILWTRNHKERKRSFFKLINFKTCPFSDPPFSVTILSCVVFMIPTWSLSLRDKTETPETENVSEGRRERGILVTQHETFGENERPVILFWLHFNHWSLRDWIQFIATCIQRRVVTRERNESKRKRKREVSDWRKWKKDERALIFFSRHSAKVAPDKVSTDWSDLSFKVILSLEKNQIFWCHQSWSLKMIRWLFNLRQFIFLSCKKLQLKEEKRKREKFRILFRGWRSQEGERERKKDERKWWKGWRWEVEESKK